MHGKLLLVACIITVFAKVYGDSSDPDIGKSMVDLVLSRGYPIEQHYATTKDGYVLGVFRIPYSNVSPLTSKRKPPVLLMHGLLDSSYGWVCQSANQSLAYILADLGYDVWMGNVRGNTWSLNHVNLTTNDKAFWDFSFDEFGEYDVPATIDLVLEVTGYSQLSYVGHSQGTTIAFASFSTKPEVAAKVKFFVGFGPVFHVEHSTSTLIDVMAKLDVDKLVSLLGFKEFLPSSKLIELIGSKACESLPHGCDVILELLCGPGRNIDESKLGAYISQTPAGTSVKNMVHWAQGVRKTGLDYYDYGCGLFSCENKVKYGTSTAPAYNIADFKVATALFYADHDDLADVQDVQYLLSNVPNLKYSQEIFNFAHLDFTWGENAHLVLYPDVIRMLQTYGVTASTMPSVIVSEA